MSKRLVKIAPGHREVRCTVTNEQVGEALWAEGSWTLYGDVTLAGQGLMPTLAAVKTELQVLWACDCDAPTERPGAAEGRE